MLDEMKRRSAMLREEEERQTRMLAEEERRKVERGSDAEVMRLQTEKSELEHAIAREKEAQERLLREQHKKTFDEDLVRVRQDNERKVRAEHA